MKNDRNKEKWVNKVMSSTNGIKPAPQPEDLFEKIMYRINNPDKQVKIIVFYSRKWAAAAAILLVVFNIGSALYAAGQNRKTSNKTTSTPLAAAMQLESTYNY